MRRLRTSLIALACLSGCAEFPQVDARITPEARVAPYPSLVPIGTVLRRRNETRITGFEEPELKARGAVLNARAAAIPRTPGVDPTIALRGGYLRTRAEYLRSRGLPPAAANRLAMLEARAELLRGVEVNDDTRLRLYQQLKALGG